MNREQGSYLSYLLRLWKTKSGGEGIWRASLENPHTGERKGFANLTDLFTFLDQEIGSRGRDSTPSTPQEEGGEVEYR